MSDVQIPREPPIDPELHNCAFLKACRGEPAPYTPIWLMRQAGRYMPEYRARRAKVGFLELCKTPELAAETTVEAAVILGVDAAILFADILLILEPLGFDLEFGAGEGPIIHNPIRSESDALGLRAPSIAADLGFVCDAVRLIRKELPRNLPLIGFAGAPFTLACYAIEGGSSRRFDRVKSFMYNEPAAWHSLMERLSSATVEYLNAQADAGVQALQIFDSWVGALAPMDYEEYVSPHMRALFQGLRPGVATIHFGTDTGALLELQRAAGGDVIGLDWKVDLADARRRLGSEVAVQGNLDPATLLAPLELLKKRAELTLRKADGRPGHIFNLGHGILPGTPVERVRALVDFVHEFRAI